MEHTDFDLWYSLIGCRANVPPEERLKLAFEAGKQSVVKPLTTAEWLQAAEEAE